MLFHRFFITFRCHCHHPPCVCNTVNTAMAGCKAFYQQHSYTHTSSSQQASIAAFVIILNASQLHDIRVSPRPASAASQLRDRWQECRLTVRQWKEFLRSEHVLSVVNLVRALHPPSPSISPSPR